MDLETRLLKTLNKPISAASPKSLYIALLKLSKEMSQEVPATTGNKKLYYISAEFLIGKLLGNNLINLGIYDEIDRILKEHGKSLAEIEKVEDEPSLGNGGLGRLAACFLDSIATLGYQGDGCGLNYHYGLFKQEFVNRKQAETPDRWLTDPSWETNTDIGFKVQLGNRIYQSRMYDLDVIGYGGGHNKLHLFDLDTVNNLIVRDGIDFDKTDIAHNLRCSFIRMTPIATASCCASTSSTSWSATPPSSSSGKRRKRAMTCIISTSMWPCRSTTPIRP